MAKAKAGKLDAALESALAEELAEIRRTETVDGQKKFVYPTVERMRIYDRALKMQSLKLKADDPEWGKEFNK